MIKLAIPQNELFQLFIENKLNHESYYERKEREGPLSPTIRCIDSKKREIVLSVHESLTRKVNNASDFPFLIVEQRYPSSSVQHYHVLAGAKYTEQMNVLLNQEFWVNDHQILQVNQYSEGTLYLPNGTSMPPTVGRQSQLLKKMKSLFLSAISEEPAYRLLSVTGLLKMP